MGDGRGDGDGGEGEARKMTAKTTIEGYNPNENPIKRVE
jgi:hypothetical protein